MAYIIEISSKHELIEFYKFCRTVTLEIGYHPEKNLSSDGQRVLHYHIYDSSLNRTTAKPMTKEVYNEYKDYLNHWGIYWHE